MPVYEYLCNDCGPFTDMRPMAECDAPQDCPQCAGESPRVILTAPNFFCMPADKRKAHATNERSANAPKTVAEYKAAPEKQKKEWSEAYAKPLEEYSTAAVAAKQGRFAKTPRGAVLRAPMKAEGTTASIDFHKAFACPVKGEQSRA